MALTKADLFSTVNRKTEFYSDFPANLDINPSTNDLSRLVNENAVARSLKNLLLVGRFEKLYGGDSGVGIRELLFEPMTIQTEDTLKEKIIEIILSKEPRASLLNVTVQSDLDRGEYTVTIVFTVINRTEPAKVDFVLKRLR